jgi:hypothetical protein
VRLYGGATADLDSLCASASEITVGAEKACGAIKQKKDRSKKESGLRRRVERVLTTSRCTYARPDLFPFVSRVPQVYSRRSSAHKTRRGKGGTYPLSHLYGYFGLAPW